MPLTAPKSCKALLLPPAARSAIGGMRCGSVHCQHRASFRAGWRSAISLRSPANLLLRTLCVCVRACVYICIQLERDHSLYRHVGKPILSFRYPTGHTFKAHNRLSDAEKPYGAVTASHSASSSGALLYLILPTRSPPPSMASPRWSLTEGLARAWGPSCGHLLPGYYDRVLSVSNNHCCLVRSGPAPDPGT